GARPARWATAAHARLGSPPARVWGVPTTALWAWRIGPARAKRLLLTGDSITGTGAMGWGLGAAEWRGRSAPPRVRRLLLTGDSITGTEAMEWGRASESAPAAELDDRFEALLERVGRLPVTPHGT